MTSLTDNAVTATKVDWLIAQACRAPSVHNTQPWRFDWDGAAFRLMADTQRGLSVSDPDSRELVISCGAALFNLKLAIRQLGRLGLVELLPDGNDPRVLARVTVTQGDPVSDRDRQLFTALSRRHTRRGGFTDRPISAARSVALQDAAYGEGASLVYINDPGPRRSVLHLAQEAEREGTADPRVREETERWTRASASSHRDGVPDRSYPSSPSAPETENLPSRDFDLGRQFGTGEGAHPPTGPIGVLMTERDLERDWICAGQALEAVLVTAAAEWAFAALHSRVCEVPRLRAELRRQMVASAYPQILLQLGHADTVPRTPRRPVEVRDASDAPVATAG
jgi:hypothetical protein